MRNRYNARRGLAVLILLVFCASFLSNPAVSTPVRNSITAWGEDIGTIVLDVSHGGEGTAGETLDANAWLDGNLTEMGFTVVWARGGINSTILSGAVGFVA